ncbi:ABC transporter permease [Gramella sp. KN1008]|uniref:ABC transporter permease n=1 Tax=Gramella sp. KN1008 TaxID=2529298 RepID=UPI00103DDEAC|nr:ABC transporter permease [Gramella sp. KN1008]TBW25901.1 ABC transporter permease [Gramella sp. KN1008]
MFTNHIKLGLRKFKKNTGFFFLNITGLSIGLAAVISIGIWIYDEVSFNKMFPDHERIARVMQTQTFAGQKQTKENQPLQLAPVLRDEYGSFFEAVATSTFGTDIPVKFGETKVIGHGSFAEASIIQILKPDLLSGSKDALNDPSSILLSESLAKSIFGDENPVGKQIKLMSSLEVLVGGVYKDLPDNSDFQSWKFIAPWRLLAENQQYEERLGWGNSWFQTFVKTAEGTSMARISDQIKNIKRERYEDHDEAEMFLFPADKWHLYSEFENGENVGGAIEYVRIFAIIGLFILLLACINFINLSTAHAMKRAKEIGIRKTLGSGRKQLIQQFFTESILLVLLSFVIAIGISFLTLPFLNEITGKSLQFPWLELWFWISGILLVFITGILASAYPAAYLSGFNPIETLKGKLKTRDGSGAMRKGLVVFQFSISILLIIGTLVVTNQINFVKDRPVNYDQELLVSIPINSSKVIKNFQGLRQQLLASPAISNVAASDVKISNTQITNGGFNWKGKDPNMNDSFYTLRATYDFGKMVNWNIVEGRDFSREFRSDSTAILINETAVEYMGLDNPVGEYVQWGNNGNFKIIGVVKDMVTRSPFDPVDPAIFVLHYGGFLNFVNIEISSAGQLETAITHAQKTFTSFDPEGVFSYSFMDEDYKKNFVAEMRTAKLIGTFSGFAILISCLGVLGLSIYMAEQRRKEIGVRKVLGASVFSIWQLLTGQFMILLLAAFVLAAPVSYFLAKEWLHKFAYKTSFEPWILLIAAGLILMIMLFTLSYQTLKSAMSNPIKAIRTE